MNMVTSRRFLPLFITQFIGAFCDNVFKNAFVLLATFGLAQAHGWNPAYAVYLIGGLFILPFVLISGWAGYVSDIWARHTLVRALKTFEAFVMIGAAVALYTDSFYGMWVIIVALGFISALFGPLKYGLLPVYLGIGNHEIIKVTDTSKSPADREAQSRADFTAQFGYWLNRPEIARDRPGDKKEVAGSTYFHWKTQQVEFIYLDNAGASGFEVAQLK